ncbi:hypothetical protein [Rubritalea tangerina]|uniref:hypothetical protein n=1 Tax=Rubritalea tangerina TaxID=430798 RepID=UPI00361E6273
MISILRMELAFSFLVERKAHHTDDGDVLWFIVYGWWIGNGERSSTAISGWGQRLVLQS